MFCKARDPEVAEPPCLGAVGVEGPVDATAMREFSRHHCYFSGGPFLVHATDPEVLGAVRRGDCWLSRLESEWWLGFDPS